MRAEFGSDEDRNGTRVAKLGETREQEIFFEFFVWTWTTSRFVSEASVGVPVLVSHLAMVSPLFDAVEQGRIDLLNALLNDASPQDIHVKGTLLLLDVVPDAHLLQIRMVLHLSCRP